MTILKDAANLADPNPVEATHVENYLLKNYPPRAVAWVKDARWIGPVNIPQDRVDYADAEKWTASRQPGVVRKFARKIRKGTGHTSPVIAVQQDGNYKVNVVDGHHRTLACRLLGRPVKAYVGFVRRNDDRWEETHASQFHPGADPQNKNHKVSVGKKSKKRNEKLPGPLKAALRRGDILPASALKGKKIPESVKAAFMKASIGKAAKGDPFTVPRVYMLRKGDSFPYRETPGSVDTAIDQLMADALEARRREAAEARQRAEKKRQEARPNRYGDTPGRVVKGVSLMSLGHGSALGEKRGI